MGPHNGRRSSATPHVHAGARLRAAVAHARAQLARYRQHTAVAALALVLGVGAAAAMASARGAGMTPDGLPTLPLPTVSLPGPPSVPGVTTPAPPTGGGGKPKPPSSGPLPPLGPYVHFSRVTYTDTPSSNDYKLQVLIVQASYAARKYVASVHRQNPNVRVLAYQSPWLRPAGDPSGVSTCLAGRGTYPSKWFMYGSRGKRQIWHLPHIGTMYQMDFANAGFLRACARHAIQEARSIGADGVFMDGLATSVHWAQLPGSCVRSGSAAKARPKRRRKRTAVLQASLTCTSNVHWQNTMTRALAYLGGQFHGHNLLFMGNIGGGNVNFTGGGGSTVWERYDSELDGAMEESWTYGTDGRPVPAARLQAGLANVAWAEAHHKYSILNDDITNCSSCSGYGMAALLLVGQKLSSYDISNGSYGSYNSWWSQYYDKGQRLGNAQGNYYTQSNGLLVRRFTYGTVVVNDTTHAINDPTFGRVAATSALIH
jgi:hypothetical protein